MFQCGGTCAGMSTPIVWPPATTVPATSNSLYVDCGPFFSVQPKTDSSKVTAASRSRVISSAHENAPRSLTTPAPVMFPGCHTENAAPVGSANTAIDPSSITCIGATIVEPPLASTLPAVAAASSTDTYMDHHPPGAWAGP